MASKNTQMTPEWAATDHARECTAIGWTVSYADGRTENASMLRELLGPRFRFATLPEGTTISHDCGHIAHS